MVNNLITNAKNYLSDTSNLYDEVTGALLFTNSNSNDDYFGQVYLFTKFGSCTDNSLNISSEITSNYTEANVFVNDHWSIKPLQYTISGLVGEVIYRPPTKYKSFVQNIISPIMPFTKLSPTLDSYTQGALNIVQGIENTVNRYTQIARQSFQAITNIAVTRESNQRKVYQELRDLMYNRQLVKVWTPYEKLENLAITNVSLRQDATTRFQSTIEIQFQEWRDVESFAREATKEEKTEWAKISQAVETNGGNIATKKTELNSTLYTLFKGEK